MTEALLQLASRNYTDECMPPACLPIELHNCRTTVGKIKSYWRRKGVYNPIAQLLSQTSNGFDPSLSRTSTTMSPSDSLRTIDGTLSSNAVSSPWSSSRQSPLSMEQLVNSPTSPFSDLHRLLSLSRSYCDIYLGSTAAALQIEHRAHRDTIYGQFGHLMQDGIAAILRHDSAAPGQGQVESALAFRHFESAFQKLNQLIIDQHPMSIALVFSVMSELAARAQHALSESTFYLLSRVFSMLVNQISDLTTRLCQADSPLPNVFLTLSVMMHVGMSETIEYMLRVMALMVDTFQDHFAEASGPSYWKLLYLKERYCDCLYHAKKSGESLRVELLHEQEQFYSPTAPNVLWTLTNVADDKLRNGKLDEAEQLYEAASARSELHGHYSKAKTRFAAKEGLAAVALEQARKIERRMDSGTDSFEEFFEFEIARTELLEKAQELFRQAYREAQVFGAGNRRALRVQAHCNFNQEA